MNNNEFCHLHVHDQYSLLDGFGTAEQYLKRANELGFTRIALTNHGSVDGSVRWQQECNKVNIIPIIGCEAYIVPNLLDKDKDKEKRFHITLLVKNETGWKNLLRMLTQANLNGFYYRPRIDPELLLQHCDGLVIMTACVLTFLNMPNGENLLKTLSEKTNVFGEIMPLQLQEQHDTNNLVLRLSKKYNLKMVATNDCHYPLAEHNKLQEVLLAMQRKDKWNNPDRWRFSVDDLFLKTADEMIESFDRQNCLNPSIYRAAIENTMEVAELCKFKLEPKKPNLPKVHVDKYPNLDEDEQLIMLTMDGLRERANDHEHIRNNIKIYEERIEEEFTHIIPSFTRYFLIVWELINWCNRNDIFCGPGRGSSAGSLVAYCLGITRVDSIKYDLVFSRFISPGRIDLPDIDMDFEDRHRDKVKQHLADIYGKWNVIEVSTFLEMHGRGALRDVGRVFDIPLYEVDKAAKAIVVRSGGDFRSDFTILDAFETFEDGRRFKEKYPEVTNIAIAFEGQIKSCGRHAAGVCVSEHDLRTGENANFVVRHGVNVCNWDKIDAEFMGLMKLDILGLNSLTILSETKNLVKARHGVDINFDLINLEDPKLYEQFTAGNTVGIFQFNSSSMIKLCRDIHGDCFDEVVAINALHRPGALRSGYTQIYRDRKFGVEEVKYIHPWVERMTKQTQGLIIYQEQVMRLMYELGGLPWKTADTIRKVISKSKGVEEFMKFEDSFINGCKRLGTLSEEDAKKIFGELKNTGSYSFNKSHSVSYSLIAVWQMYLKVYYPLEFIVTLLSYGPSVKKHEIINEAKRLNIKISLPDINLSDSDKWIIVDNNSLLAPFREIKGIGEVAAKEIVDCRGIAGLYKSPEDLEAKVPKRKVNKKVRTLLIESGAFLSPSEKVNLSNDKLETLSNLFDFELSNDPLYKYRGIIKKISSRIDIVPLSKTHSMGNKPGYFFGRIESFKTSYRDTVAQHKEGGFDILRGVYGYIKDDSDFKMLIFGNKIYHSKKYAVEHCEGQACLTQAQAYRADKTAIRTESAWFGDDLINGDLEGLKLGFGTFMDSKDWGDDSPYHIDTDLFSCDDCELRAECTKPVSASIGHMNMMLVGEAPGSQEDAKGIGFIGKSGRILFSALEERGFKRNLFHVSNVVKCFTDPKTKIYTLNGMKTIDNINVGDMVLSHKGKFKRVGWVSKDNFIKRGEKLVKIKYSLSLNDADSKHTKTIKITPEHKFLIKGEWVEAKNIKVGDKISVLTKNCLQCGKQMLITKHAKCCGISCATKYRNANTIWTDKMLMKKSESMKTLYRLGKMNKKLITKKANKANIKKVKNGTHHLLSKNRTIICPWKGQTKHTNEKLAMMSGKTKKTNTESGHLKRLAAIGREKLNNYYKTHERKASKRKIPTMIEKIMNNALIKNGYIENVDYIRDMPIKKYRADFCLLKHNIVVECNGHHWHSTAEATERDRKRDKELAEIGYTTIRFSGKEVINDIQSCIDSIKRISKNHEGGFIFNEVEVLSVKMITNHPKRRLYNFGVDGDNSYIADGLVSHNCFPSTTKTPKKKHVHACSKWLKEEIETVKPFIILSFGNTGNLFFRGEASGITDINGTTIWNQEHDCWITYSIHPAMVAYSEDNRPLLDKSLDEFAKKVNILM